MRQNRHLVSILSGVASFLLTSIVLWLVLRDTPAVQGNQIRWTVRYIIKINHRLDEFYRATGEYPQTLDELPELLDDGIPLASGRVVDAFGTPFKYELRDTGPVVYSYGSDRKRGGVGISADVHVDTPVSETRPTLCQLLFQLPAGKHLLSICAVISLVVSYLCFLFSGYKCICHECGERHWLGGRETRAATAICVGILIVARSLRSLGLFK